MTKPLQVIDNEKDAFPIVQRAFGDFIRENRGSLIHFTAKKLSTFMRNNGFPLIKDGEDDRILGLILRRMERIGVIEMVDPNHNGGKLYKIIRAKKEDVGTNSKLLSIPLSSLREPKYVHRVSNTETGDVDLSDLMVSIREIGMLDPIKVRAIGKETYEITDGIKRYRACLNLGDVKTVQVLASLMDDKTAWLDGFVANTRRRNLKDWEVGKSLYYALESNRWYTPSEISKAAGIPLETVRAYLDIFSYPEEIQTGIQQGKIDFKDAFRLWRKVDSGRIEEDKAMDLLGLKHELELDAETASKAAEILESSQGQKSALDAVREAQSIQKKTAIGFKLEDGSVIVGNRRQPTFKCPHGTEFEIDVKNVVVVQRQTAMTEFISR